MRSFLCGLALVACIAPGVMHAQAPLQPRGERFVIRDAIRTVTITPEPSPRLTAQSPQPSPRRTAIRRVLGAAVGATAGFFAGGYTGAWIEGDRCNCDDPGLKGALIGAPIGAAVGGILGGFYLF